jgi:gliding motility-associated-like protein
MIRIFLIFSFIAFFSAPCFSKVWKVDDTGYATPAIGGNLTLPMAITNASPGDTILINIKGTMFVSGSDLVFNKPLTIIGPSASHFTIDANSFQVKFDLPAGNIYLEGVRFINSPCPCGPFLSLLQGVTVTIKNCVFEGLNTGGNGGAINMQNNAFLTVENTSFFNCTSSTFGGAVYVGPTNSATVRNCTFFNNTAQEGGAIYNDGNVLLVNNTFLDNTSTTSSGHAVKDGNTSAGSNTRIQNNIFTDPQSGDWSNLLSGSPADIWTSDGGNVFSQNGPTGFFSGGPNDMFGIGYAIINLRINPVTDGYGLKYFPITAQTSAAVDNGTGGGNISTTDCRRAPRVLYGNNVLMEDAGAVEFSQFTVTSNNSAGFITTWNSMNSSVDPGPKYMDFDVSGGGPVNFNLTSQIHNLSSSGIVWIMDGFTQDGSTVPGPGTLPTDYTPGNYSIHLLNNSSDVINLSSPGNVSVISGLWIDNGGGFNGIVVSNGNTHIFGNHIISSGGGTIGVSLNLSNFSQIGGPLHYHRNVIGNQSTAGIYTTNQETTIQGNFIGTTATGTGTLSNDKGIILQAVTAKVIGKFGFPSMNLISGNASAHIDAQGGYFEIKGNIIGPDITANSLLTTTAVGITVQTATGKIGDTYEGDLNVIGGCSDGIQLNSSNNVVVFQNFIGVSPLPGFASIQNSQNGISINSPGPGNHMIGNGFYNGRNYICNSTLAGISIINSGAHTIVGNFIGIKPDNTSAGNGPNGIYLNQANTNSIDVMYNVIGGHSNAGIYSTVTSGGHDISYNRIGTDSTGMNSIPNGTGVKLTNETAQDDMYSNIISGNSQEGLLAQNSIVNFQNNIVGLAADSTNYLSNLYGVVIQNGGGSSILNNLISGNNGVGISLQATTYNTVSGNIIGTTPSGLNRGNVGHGIVSIFASHHNTIGGLAPASYNVIAYNNGAGVNIEKESYFNGILGNYFLLNTAHGITLNADVSSTIPLANDVNDPDVSGPAGANKGNNGQNYPENILAQYCGGNAMVTGQLNVDVFPNDYYIQVYKVNPLNVDASGHGEGDSLVAFTTVNATSNIVNFSVPVTGGLLNDIYAVTASKINSTDFETSEFSDTVKVKSAFTATATITTPVNCNGGVANVTVSHGGSAPFSYNWVEVGVGATGITTVTASLPAGTYTCAVTDAACTIYSDTIIITEPVSLAVTVTPTNPSCNGSCDGSLVLTESGGTGPYQYSINNGTTYQASNTFNALCAGPYLYLVQDANGCLTPTTGNTVNLFDPPVLTLTPVITNESCSGLNDGTISLSASGGNPPYNYSIDGGGFSATSFYSGISPGFHSVDLMDANGCNYSTGVTIVAGDLVFADFSVSNTTGCQNIPDFNFSDISTTSSGTINTWTWSLPSGSPSGGTIPNLTNVYLFNSGTNFITLQVTNTNGCTDDTIMAVNAFPAVYVNAGNDTSVCQGSTFTHDAFVSGGSGGNIYSWTPAGNFVSGTIEDPTITSTIANATGNYTQILNVTDINGCTDADTVVVSIVPLPSVSAGVDLTVCFGNNTTLSGTGSAISYTWDNGVIDGTPFPPSVTTTYTVTGIDAAGCTSTDQVVVTVETPATLNAGLDLDVCRSGTPSVNLNATANNYGTIIWTTTGTGSWTNSNTLNPTYTFSGADISGPNVSLIATVTSLGGSCTNVDDTVIVTFHDLPTAATGSDFSICSSAGSFTLTGTVTNSASISWTNGTGIFSPDNLSLTTNYSPSAAEVTAGTVSLTLTAFATAACPDATDVITVTLLTSPVANAGADASVCTGMPYTLDASASTGSISTYQWDEVGVGFVASTVITSVTPTVTTSYALTVDNGSCNDLDTIVITVSAAPDPTFTYSASSYCQNDPLQTPASIVTAGGTFSMPLAPGSINATTGEIDISTLGPGTYGVIYTLTSPCLAADTIPITINSLPNATINGPATGCENSAVVDLNTLFNPITTGGTWSGTGVTDPNFDPVASGTGTFILSYSVTDGNGCTNVDTAAMIVYPVPTVSFTGVNTAYCETDAPFMPVGTPSGGLWSVNGAPFTTITSIDPATFPIGVTIPVNYQYTDATTGCFNTALPSGFTVYAMPLGPNPTSALTQTVCSGTTVTLTATNPNSGNGTLTWFADFGLTTQLGFGPSYTTPPLTGNTTVYLAIVNAGCISTVVVYTITVNNAQVSAGPDLFICPGAPAQLNVTSATGTINWSPGTSLDDSTLQNPVATPNVNTTYIVTVTNGPCTDSDTVNVILDGSNADCGIVPSYNAFSPDLDGVNDTWIIDAVYFHPDNTVTIFNRWGDELVSFEDYDNVNVVWDGTYKGNMLPSGTYFYIIEYHDINMQIDGWLQLTR